MTESYPRAPSRPGHVPGPRSARSPEDERAFREGFRLLVAFGVSAVPATLLLAVMGVDFVEGDFGPAGTSVMALAGGASIVCAVASVAARRLWAAGKPLGRVLAMLCWPLLLTLVALGMSMLVFTLEFSFLLRKP